MEKDWLPLNLLTKEIKREKCLNNFWKGQKRCSRFGFGAQELEISRTGTVFLLLPNMQELLLSPSERGT